jgi:hypothetical protein
VFFTRRFFPVGEEHQPGGEVFKEKKKLLQNSFLRHKLLLLG